MSKSNSKASLSVTPESVSSDLTPSKLSKLPRQSQYLHTSPTNDSLSDEIRSKQRTLSLLDRKLEGSAAFEEQLHDRDRRIESLNARVIAAEAKVKVSTKAAVRRLKDQISQLQLDLFNSKATQLKGEEAVNQLMTEVADLKARAEDEKESGALLSEALTEEVEGLKGQLEVRKGQTAEMKKDIMQLSKIIQDMVTLNAELNAKIDSINKETAALNTDYYTAVAKAEQTEQLEKELSEQIIASQRSEKLASRLADTLEKSHQGRLAIESASREVQSSLHQLGQSLTALTASSNSDPSVAQVAAQVAEGLKDARHKLKAVTPQEPSKVPQVSQERDENSQQEQLFDLKNLVKEKDRQLAREQQEVNDLKNRISRFETQTEKAKADADDSAERNRKRLAVLLEQVTSFSERLDSYRDELVSKENEVQVSQTQALHLKDRLESTRLKLKDHTDRASYLERLMKEHRTSNARIQAERFEDEKKNAAKERRMEKTMANYKSMQEELFHKDSEIMRKSKEAYVLAQQVADLQEKLKAFTAKNRSPSIKGSEEYVRRLEAKDREIELLKEMMRGAQLEVRQKDSMIARYRKRPDEGYTSVRNSRNIEDETSRGDELFASVERGDTLTNRKKVH